MEYRGFAFRQVEHGPVQVVFVATSCDVDTWAKVPTKLARTPRGFQRPVMKPHVREVTRFFADDSTGQNSSPTTLLIGMDPESAVKASLLDETGAVLTGVAQEPVPCRVRIDFAPWSRPDLATDPNAEIAELWKLVRPLFAAAGAAPPTLLDSTDDEGAEGDEAEMSETTDEDGADSEADEDDQEGEEPGPADDSEDSEEDPDLLRLTSAEIAAICESKAYESWALPKRRELIRMLKDERKPGLVIDGQHRIEGTRNRGEMPFSVTLLPQASWAELAFQFIVNNGTAKQVKEGLLINIVGHSLTPEEVSATQTRLYKSGIKVALIQAVMRAHTEENPFSGMLKFGQPGEPGFLDAPAFQKKIMTLWYGSRGRSGDKPRFGTVRVPSHDPPYKVEWSLADAFGAVCDGANVTEKTQDWQAKHWFAYFKAFWTAIKEQFQGRLWPATVDDWPTKNQNADENDERMRLMRVTVLGLLQSAVINKWYWHKREELESDGQSFANYKPSPAEFQRKIAYWVSKIPSDFFTELRFRGFDASQDLRDDLSNQFIALLESKTSMPVLKAQHRFWQQHGG